MEREDGLKGIFYEIINEKFPNMDKENEMKYRKGREFQIDLTRNDPWHNRS